MIFTNHCKFKAQLAAIVGAGALFFNSQAKADGVILIKDYPNQSLHGWKAFSFREIERFSISYTVTLTTGQQQVFTTDRVVTIIQEPKWEELILTSDADWKNLDLQKSKLLASAAQFPQLKVWAQEMALKFDGYLTQNSPSTVVYQGKLISKDDWNKLSGLGAPSNSTAGNGVIPLLKIRSVELRDVKLKSFDETRVSLVHSNGIQGFNLADLKETEISSLGKAFPEFADHMQKLLTKYTAKTSGLNTPMEEDKSAVVISRDYAQLLRAKNPGSQLDLPVVDGIQQSFVLIPAGTFTMGRELGEEGPKDDVKQVHVRISKPFWMANTEVTQAQYEAVMEKNPSFFKSSNLPVENIRVADAQSYTSRLNKMGILPKGWKFALPTEAQWEYACRAGEIGDYSGGVIDEVGWYEGNSGKRTHEVGQKKANAWGLYDMHGNVWEWCADWYAPGLKGGTDPIGPSSGEYLVGRGGAWCDPAKVCRTYSRFGYALDHYNNDQGFRVVIVPDDLFEIKNKTGAFSNSLGMQFVHVPQTQIMICIHETRTKDFVEYLKSQTYNRNSQVNSIIEVDPILPVAKVSYTDAMEFCKWLSDKEKRSYRLPTDQEWSAAVGLTGEIGLNPKEKSVNSPLEIYPWGSYYPPRKYDGNYGLTEIKRLGDNFNYIDDGFRERSPVMSFEPNRLGIFDMGGNVREWCLDWFDEKQDTRVTRGTSYFYLYAMEDYRSSWRHARKPQERDSIVGFRCAIVLPTTPSEKQK